MEVEQKKLEGLPHKKLKVLQNQPSEIDTEGGKIWLILLIWIQEIRGSNPLSQTNIRNNEMKDGKGNFYRKLRLDKEGREALKWFRRAKFRILKTIRNSA